MLKALAFLLAQDGDKGQLHPNTPKARYAHCLSHDAVFGTATAIATSTTGSTSNVLKRFAFSFIFLFVPFLGGTKTLPTVG
jgi:hypothetical protein